VIACETGVADVGDPLGGSTLVEAWTGEIAERARALIARIDSLGGAVAAIEGGFFAREIEEASYAAQRELEEGRRLVVGVNVFREESDAGPPLLTVDPAIEREQVERLRAFRAARDSGLAKRSLEQLKAGAREDRNLVPVILAAVQSSATLGEIIGALKTVWGEYRPGG
jgi:methylmalonyl-CoA mutase N-terminal domain/subunit